MDEVWTYVLAGLGLMLLVLPFAVGIWALRRHDRIFPKGFDRTGWHPDTDRERRFETWWAWLAGRGGP